MSEVVEIHNKDTLSPPEFEAKVVSLIEELRSRLFDITEENFLNPNCIDWRDLDNARPSIPGGWLWALWVILASLDSIGSDVDRTTVISNVKEFFNWTLTGHTQDHWDHSHNCQWCGHAHRLITEWERYSLSSESSQLLEQESNLITEPDVLKWKHFERNVFIVNIPWKGIKANTWEIQDFVYNSWYAQELYARLIQYLEEKLHLELDLESVLQIANNHFMETGWDLAQNKDVFSITDVDDDNVPEIEYLMTVPEKEAV